MALQDGALRARVDIPGDSVWFEGHFPGEPILPGVAQVMMAQEAIMKGFSPSGGSFSMKRVKFNRVVRPDSSLDVFVEKKRESMYSFSLSQDGETVSSGFMEFDL
jgi:3-hydroxymyristoyl/3-hydroxydecanoyl-(acyl carrier protein) dehydratase